jgi:hypothetical protein
VFSGTRWSFDGEAGLAVLTAERIQRNETAIIEQCRRFRAAEMAYRALPGKGVPGFASKIRSAPGQHDGLVWQGTGDEDGSLLGPLFAAAAYAERAPGEEPAPLFGYYFKVLTAQGIHAPGGAQDYRANGLLLNGFALIAWPAAYGVSGAHSFLINHLGSLYRKDLGSQTADAVERLAVFDPDPSWEKLRAVE